MASHSWAGELATEVGPARSPRAPRPTRLPYIVAATWYAVFIARSSFTIDGRRTFTLFDDAMISMTFARNLAGGHGLVWYPGAPKVEGITNLGWTLVMAVPHLLGVPDRFAALTIEILGALILLACGMLAGRLAAALSEHVYAPVIATTLVLFSYPLVFWTLRGMEVGALTLLLLVVVVRVVETDDRRASHDAFVCGAAVLAGVVTRLDFTVFVVVLVPWIAWQRRGTARRLLLTGVAAGAIVGVVGQELFRKASYGEWTPNTYVLKLGGTTISERVARGGGSVVYQLMTAIGLACIAAWWAWRAAHATRPVLALALGLASAAAAYSVYVGGDAWEWYRFANRYLTPAVVLLFVVAAVGIDGWVREPERPREARVLTVAIAAVLLLVLLDATPLARDLQWGSAVLGALAIVGPLLFVRALWSRRAPGETQSTRAVAVMLACAIGLQVSGPALGYWLRFGYVNAREDRNWARAGDTVRRFTRPDARIAVSSAGSLPYFSHRPGLDILGKMDRRIAREPIHSNWYFFPGHMKWDYAVTLSERPDVIAQLWQPTSADLAAIRDAGFAWYQLRPEVVARLGLDARANHDTVRFLVRRDSTAVDFSLLEPVAATTTG